MLVTTGRKLARDEGGAIAPLYALALFGLIGMAGVGFDYARVMALDTELQNAADQAALAAATQLTGEQKSFTNAKKAVNDYFAKTGGVVVNQTRLSNIADDSDGDTRAINNVSFSFWESYKDDRPCNKPCSSGTTYAPLTDTASEDDPDAVGAGVVEVIIRQRAVRYALTPIVGAIVGRAGASAMAAMDTAYCKAPPLMVCAPNPNLGAYDPVTKSVPDKGKGMRLHLTPPGSTEDMPSGLFGLLAFPYGSSNNKTQTLGLNVTDPSCTGSTVGTESGVVDTQDNALNTRLDVYESSAPNCDVATGSFCPSPNSTKDRFLEIDLGTGSPSELANRYASTACAKPNGKPVWKKMSDVGTNATGIMPMPPAVGNPGYTRDLCHLGTGSGCTATSVFGDGKWDIASYMKTAHPSTYNSTTGTVTYPTDLSSRSTRYEVFTWENKPGNLPSTVKAGYTVSSQGGNYKGTMYCAFPSPIFGTGVAPPKTLKDRRVLSVAAVDCTGLKPNAPVKIIRYIDTFLVRPAEQGGDKEFYVEIIGEDSSGLLNTFQSNAKRKAVLLR